jgi:hypothetical protein
MRVRSRLVPMSGVLAAVAGSVSLTPSRPWRSFRATPHSASPQIGGRIRSVVLRRAPFGSVQLGGG